MKKSYPFKTAFTVGLVLMLAVFAAAASAPAEPWKFGIISDTQWTVADADAKNPNSCAAGIIKQVDQQFIKEGVRLVIAVGDTVDKAGDTVSDSRDVNIETRALYAQDLYNHGIGFYPLRGNHEATEGANFLNSGLVFQNVFPQIGTLAIPGLNNTTPADILAGTTSIIPPADYAANPPAPPHGKAFKAGWNFSYPAQVNMANNSISYSFDYKDARFILLDQFDKAGEYYPSTVPDQQPWIDGQISDPRRPPQVFVFSHKNLLGGNHKDNLFNGPFNGALFKDPGDGFGVDIASLTPGNFAALEAKQQAEDAFVTSLAENNVRFFISGHDHHHYHSIVTSPFTAEKSVHQLITQSDSSKFYTPVAPFSANDLPLAQDLYRVGYYIVTVDGPRVTVDYYASDATFPTAFSTTPTLNFVKRGSFGYSLNGKEFLVAQGGPYTSVQDRFYGTAAKILSGANGSTAQTNTGRSITKAVNTGWSFDRCDLLASNVLTVWGMADVGTAQTDVYTLSMTYGHKRFLPLRPGTGCFGLATRDGKGRWVNAVDNNFGGVKKFVAGPWNSSYGLGTYGVDPSTHTAWAVINYNGDFAVARNLKPIPGYQK
jgi:hypothetical protein